MANGATILTDGLYIFPGAPPGLFRAALGVAGKIKELSEVGFSIWLFTAEFL